MRTKIAMFVAALMAALGLSTAVAAPAMAAYSDCPSGSFCLWSSGAGTGTRWSFAYSTFLAGTNNGIRLNSTVSNNSYSWYNRTGTAVYVFDGGTCGSSTWNREMQNGQYATYQGSDWGGRISSLQLWNAYPLSC